jgi:cellulose synthase operon protein C
MKTRINLRFLAISLTCFAALVPLTYLLNKWQIQRTAGIWLEKAKKAEAKSNLQEATDDYENYLFFQPKDAEAQVLYGSLLLNLGRFDYASQFLEGALRINPSDSDVRRKAVQAAIGSGRVADARDHLDNYLLKESPLNPELWELEGLCQMKAGEFVAAAHSLEKAIQWGPSEPKPYMQLIGLLTAQRNELAKDKEHLLEPFPADQRTDLRNNMDWLDKVGDYWTEQMVRSCSKEPQVYVFRGYQRCSQGRFEDGIRDAEAALKLKADDPRALHLATIGCLGANKPEKAREYALRAVKASPKDPRMYEVLANIEVAGQRPDEAIRWLRLGIEEADQPKLRWTLGTLLIAKGRCDEARELAQALRNRTYRVPVDAPVAVAPELYADLLDAEIDRAQGHWLTAAERIEKIGAELKSSPELARQAFFGLGNCYEQLADRAHAEKAYRQAVDADPLWIPARAALAATLYSLGRLEDALEIQRTLVGLKDAPPVANVELARWLILKTLRSSPESRDWTQVESLIEEIAKADPKSPAAALLRAEMLITRGRADEAAKQVLAARDKRPDDLACWLALVDLAIRDGHWDRAKHILDDAQKNLGDSVSLRLARANYLGRKADKDAAEHVRKLADGLKGTPAEQARLWGGLLTISLHLDDFEQAQQLCRRLMAQQPGDLGLRMDLFTIAAAANDAALLDEALAKIEQIEGKGPVWHYGMAYRLSQLDQRQPTAGANQKPGNPDDERQRRAALEQALGHLAEVRRVRSSWVQAILLDGLINEQVGREQTALASYLEAIQLGDSSLQAISHALPMLYRRGQYTAANSLLHKLEEQQIPFDTALFREQSKVLGTLRDFPGAVKAARRVAATSKDYRDHLWLGQLLVIENQREEAEKALRAALSLDERAPEVWVALVQFYAQTGQRPLAEKTLVEARGNIPTAKAPPAIAACLEALGKGAEASRQYAEALKLTPNDPRLLRAAAINHIRNGELVEAAEKLNRIVKGQVPATAQEMAEARSALARVRGDQGGYPNLLEAIRLIDENLAAASLADDLRLKARLLSIHPQLARRREATAIFEKLVEDPRSAIPDDRFRLAQNYLAAGDWKRARPQFLAILTAQNRQPEYLTVFVQALLAQNQVNEATSWIERLEAIAPNALNTVRLRAELHFRKGDAKQAVATLTQFVEKAPAGSPERAFGTVAAAAALDAFASFPGVGRPMVALALEKAEELLRKFVKDDPKQKLVLVDYLGRRKRMDEALGMADEAFGAAEPTQIAAGCQSLLRQPDVTPAQIARIAAIVDTAMKAHNRPIPLLLVMALVREAQQNYAEAETLYRELLKKDGNFAAAMNNLAGLLAFSGRQLEEARELIERAIAIAGPEPALLDTCASVYLALGQPVKALADMQEVIEQQPAANRYFHLARAQWKLGHRAEAAEAMEKARAMGLRPESLPGLEGPAYEELVRGLQ